MTTYYPSFHRNAGLNRPRLIGLASAAMATACLVAAITLWPGGTTEAGTSHSSDRTTPAEFVGAASFQAGLPDGYWVSTRPTVNQAVQNGTSTLQPGLASGYSTPASSTTPEPAAQVLRPGSPDGYWVSASSTTPASAAQLPQPGMPDGYWVSTRPTVTQAVQIGTSTFQPGLPDGYWAPASTTTPAPAAPVLQPGMPDGYWTR